MTRNSFLAVGVITLLALVVGGWFIYEGRQRAEIVSQADYGHPTHLNVLLVNRSFRFDRIFDYEVYGFLTSQKNQSATVRIPRTRSIYLRPDETLTLYPTGAFDPAFISKYWYQAQLPILSIGGIRLSWHGGVGVGIVVIGLIFAVMCVWLAWRRRRRFNGVADGESDQLEAALIDRSKRQLVILLLLGDFVVLGGILVSILAFVGIWIVMNGDYGLLVSLLAAFCGFGLVIFTAVNVNALFFNVAPQSARALSRDEAPQLYDMVDDFRRQLRGPKVHAINITDEFTMSAEFVPRFGLIGGQRNIITVGMPTMLASSGSEITAGIAHEYRHFAGAGGRFESWMLRGTHAWYHIASNIPDDCPVHQICCGWITRYFVHLLADTEPPIRRQRETLSDEFSKQVAGAQAAQDGLARLVLLRHRFTWDFWKSVWTRAKFSEQPDIRPFAELGSFFKKPLDAEFCRKMLDHLGAEQAHSSDSHPLTIRRLTDLHTELKAPADLTRSAAEEFLSSALPALIDQMDRDWEANAAPHWQEHFQEARKARDDLKLLIEESKSRPLSEDEKWACAVHTETGYGVEAGLSAYRTLLESNADHVSANLAVGYLLLGQFDEAGLPHLERAMKRDPYCVWDACGRACDYLNTIGRHEDAEYYLQRAYEQDDVIQLAEGERDRLDPYDVFLPHELDADSIRSIVDQLRKHPDISEAFLVRKSVRYLPQNPLYVLGVTAKVAVNSPWGERPIDAVLAEALTMPSRFYVVWHQSEDDVYRRAMQKVVDSSLFTAPEMELECRSTERQALET